jgi:hypothetical protein
MTQQHDTMVRSRRWRPAVRGLVALCVASALIGFPTAASAQDVVSCAKVSFQSIANGKYVTAELGKVGTHYGMLRARATSVGPWELFKLCYHTDGGWFHIESWENKLFVRVHDFAEGRYQWMLTASASSLSGAATFYRDTGSVGWSAFRYSATFKWVSTELSPQTYPPDELGMLRARANAIGPWEQFAVAIRN